MDKRTRMLSAMNKLPVDHVPVGMWFHFSGEEEKGQACIDAHLRYYRETDLDFVKIMCDGYFPYPFNYEIKEASDWYKVTPLGKDHPYITEQVARAKAIVEAIGKERCVFYNVFAPFSSIRFSYPDELVMKHLSEDRLAVMHALDVVAQDRRAGLRRLCRKAEPREGQPDVLPIVTVHQIERPRVFKLAASAAQLQDREPLAAAVCQVVFLFGFDFVFRDHQRQPAVDQRFAGQILS